MSNIILSMLLPGLQSRSWEDMYNELYHQASEFDDVEILVDIDRGEVPSGVKRQRLSRQAIGKYIAFVDDDDRVEPDYIKALRTACLEGPDVVTFNLRLTRPDKPQVENWSYRLDYQCRPKGIMTANHLCAWKRRLALSVGWCPDLGYADDQLWYQPLFYSGLAKNELHIDRTLYHYLFDPSVTENQKADRISFAKRYVGSGLRCFWLGDQIVIECRHPDGNDPGMIVVRDSENVEHVVQKSELVQFHIIRIA